MHYHAHDDVIKWKHFPRNWPFVREIHRSPVNFPHKGQWHGALMFSLIYVWINDWVNNREAGDLRRQHGHYDVIVMLSQHHTHMGYELPNVTLSGLIQFGISDKLIWADEFDSICFKRKWQTSVCRFTWKADYEWKTYLPCVTDIYGFMITYH